MSKGFYTDKIDLNFNTSYPNSFNGSNSTGYLTFSKPNYSADNSTITYHNYTPYLGERKNVERLVWIDHIEQNIISGKATGFNYIDSNSNINTIYYYNANDIVKLKLVIKKHEKIPSGLNWPAFSIVPSGGLATKYFGSNYGNLPNKSDTETTVEYSIKLQEFVNLNSTIHFELDIPAVDSEHPGNAFEVYNSGGEKEARNQHSIRCNSDKWDHWTIPDYDINNDTEYRNNCDLPAIPNGKGTYSIESNYAAGYRSVHKDLSWGHFYGKDHSGYFDKLAPGGASLYIGYFHLYVNKSSTDDTPVIRFQVERDKVTRKQTSTFGLQCRFYARYRSSWN